MVYVSMYLYRFKVSIAVASIQLAARWLSFPDDSRLTRSVNHYDYLPDIRLDNAQVEAIL